LPERCCSGIADFISIILLTHTNIDWVGRQNSICPDGRLDCLDCGMVGRSAEVNGHAVDGWSMIVERTVQANLIHNRMVGSSFATVFGPDFSFNKRCQMFPVRPRRVPLSIPGRIACPSAPGACPGDRPACRHLRLPTLAVLESFVPPAQNFVQRPAAPLAAEPLVHNAHVVAYDQWMQFDLQTGWLNTQKIQIE
jgi:hypothetical protein